MHPIAGATHMNVQPMRRRDMLDFMREFQECLESFPETLGRTAASAASAPRRVAERTVDVAEALQDKAKDAVDGFLDWLDD